MQPFNHFPKIHAVGTRYVQSIFENDVEVTEKIDGSQFAFALIDGELKVRSKNSFQHLESPDKMFAPGVEYLQTIKNNLAPGIIYYGEYLWRPKHNVLAYSRVPKGFVALFGMRGTDGNWINQHSILSAAASAIGVDVVPLLYYGKIDSADTLKAMLKRESVLGGPNIEGVVVKNYHRCWLYGGEEQTIMVAKYVSEEFKEVHGERWQKENTGKGKYEVLKEKYKTPARWMKAIQRMREAGTLEGSPRDIGKLIAEVKRDVEEEERDSIKEALYHMFAPDVIRTSVHGLAEWYKEKLLDDSFVKDAKNEEVSEG